MNDSTVTLVREFWSSKDFEEWSNIFEDSSFIKERIEYQEVIHA